MPEKCMCQLQHAYLRFAILGIGLESSLGTNFFGMTKLLHKRTIQLSLRKECNIFNYPGD